MFSAILPGFQLHIEVWVLILAILGFGVYVGKIVTKYVGKPVANRNKATFLTAVLLLWLASDWPLHDLAENYLYFTHVIQHLLIVFIVPPLLWISVPDWFAELLIKRDKNGELPKWLKRAGHPIAAGLIFNVVLAATHIPGVVNTSVSNGPFHYFIHLLLFASAMAMWLPVLSPYPELELSAPPKMIYLFSMSLLPTIPAAFLTFATAPIYEAYAIDNRIWSFSAVSDQQAAGVIMKLIGGFYLWILIGIVFFRWLNDKETQKSAPTPEQPQSVYGQDEPDREQSHDHNLQKSNK